MWLTGRLVKSGLTGLTNIFISGYEVGSCLPVVVRVFAFLRCGSVFHSPVSGSVQDCSATIQPV